VAVKIHLALKESQNKNQRDKGGSKKNETLVAGFGNDPGHR
jgi:hypothetical protein